MRQCDLFQDGNMDVGYLQKLSMCGLAIFRQNLFSSATALDNTGRVISNFSVSGFWLVNGLGIQI